MWALPITIYLFIKDVSPKQFVDVSGFFILMGCFPVFLGYYSTDVLSNEMFKYGLIGALFSPFYLMTLNKNKNGTNKNDQEANAHNTNKSDGGTFFGGDFGGGDGGSGGGG